MTALDNALEEKRYCTVCGIAMDSDSTICINCGSKTPVSSKSASTSGERWFAQGGNLDDSANGDAFEANPGSTVHNAELNNQKRKASEDVFAQETAFLKPVRILDAGTGRPNKHGTAHPAHTAAENAGDSENPGINSLSKCKKCGTAVPKGTHLCWKCSSADAGAVATNAEEFVPITPTPPANLVLSHKRTIIIGVIACLVVIITVILLAKGGVKSVNQIRSELPEQVKSIYIDNEKIPLTVKNVRIDRRKTEKGLDQVYCIIELASEEIAVTRYEQLGYVKYNGNDWRLEWYAPYDSDEIKVLKATDNLYDWAIQRIQYSDSVYSDLKHSILSRTATTNGREVILTFDVDQTLGLLHLCGQIKVNGNLSGDVYEGYYWSGSVDDNSMEISWSLAGTWQGGMSNWGMGWYEFSINVEYLGVDGISCDWTYDSDGNVHAGDGSDCWIIKYDNEMIEIGVRYDTALASYLDVTYYVDGTCMVYVPFLGEFQLELE